ncbi:CAP domain-containing protein [Flavobacterium sp. I-SCBP12n]|uniref:CAP domain-containing protein n=2 Tax=Flavobacterium TaxID=237 RepID=A0A9X1XWC5_9FLAO|nr:MULTISPECIES: CAP domain-containing protein [Flavobacterium]MBP4141913.1 CAP domain-containing protein [Flavobacterium flabelliforme]MCK8142921.1 CAP domain-containing protein [Flavobacterium pygoscelis]MCK8143252.1 CAP domain-containing protein [Flavobacterium pygoscelis]
MKLNLLYVLLLGAVMCSSISCSSDNSETQSADASVEKVINYSYNSFELETMNLINDHRASLGLKRLERINHMSYKSEEHDNYMITNNVVNHNDFVARSENIMKTLGAKSVGENIAYNYSTPKAVLDAWLASPGHRENIEGNFTHFGIAIKENPANGRKYYTNIFAKI